MQQNIWENMADILEVLRQKADRTNNVYDEKKQISIINDLQMFLSLAFMVLIPIEPAKTSYELEIGRTFVYGIHKEDKFTSASKMEDPHKAVWYIHLMPGDYKTGRFYGELWKIMPNREFPDGKKLYDYIDRWLNQGREYQQKCNHNFFFRSVQKYRQLNSSEWNIRIKNIFLKEVRIPVAPKDIRCMYIASLRSKQ